MSPVVDPGPDGVRALLRVSVVLAFVAAVVGMVGESSVSRSAAGVAVAVLVVTPLVRVLVLGRHWATLGDRRFALLAFTLLAVVIIPTIWVVCVSHV